MTVDDLDTPCVLVDMDKVRRNLVQAQDYASASGLRLRPHIKTHKLPQLAKLQMQLGAIGITCQKLGEAEVMAGAGLSDIMIPYNIIGAAKLARLKALHARISLIAGADSAHTIAGYAATFTDTVHPLQVLVECDTGMHRCGVATPAEILPLARLIAAAPGLQFAGIFTYPAAGDWRAALDWLQTAKDLLTKAGLPPAIISSGGTPDLYHAAEGRGLVTEYRPGTYIYSDRYQAGRGIGTLEDCALTVLATVISKPAPDRVVVDAGSKSLTSDTLGLSGFGFLPEYPQAVVTGLSEEHGQIDLAACTARPATGDRVRIIPNHACVVSNLVDAVHLVSGHTVLETVPVAARGRVG